MYFPDAAADAVRLLRSLDVAVDFPPGQTCCGQPAFNAGHQDLARRMAEHAREVFAGAEDVVLPSGSCTAMLRRFTPALFGEAPLPHGPPTHAAPRFWELAEYVVHALGTTVLGDGLRGLRVAYHHGCHALRELALSEEPLLLLERAGARVVPWEAARECCGFGGLFSIKFPEVSAAMADRKLDTLPEVDVLTSADAGCLLQLAGRMERQGGALPVRPLASLLWQARAGGDAGAAR